MCDPKIMCRQHLLGEHNECHMFLGSLRKKISMNGYFKNDLLEPLSLKSRHDALAEEIIRRGYNHTSILEFSDEVIFEYLTDIQIDHKINKDNSLMLLLTRCNQCNQNYLKFLGGEQLNEMFRV